MRFHGSVAATVEDRVAIHSATRDFQLRFAGMHQLHRVPSAFVAFQLRELHQRFAEQQVPFGFLSCRIRTSNASLASGSSLTVRVPSGLNVNTGVTRSPSRMFRVRARRLRTRGILGGPERRSSLAVFSAPSVLHHRTPAHELGDASRQG